MLGLLKVTRSGTATPCQKEGHSNKNEHKTPNLSKMVYAMEIQLRFSNSALNNVSKMQIAYFLQQILDS